MSSACLDIGTILCETAMMMRQNNAIWVHANCGWIPRSSPSSTLPGVWKVWAIGFGLGGKRCSHIWKSSVPESENAPSVGLKLSYCFSGWLWPDPCSLAQWKHTWSLLEGNWQEAGAHPCGVLYDLMSEWSKWNNFLLHPAGRGASRLMHVLEIPYKYG